MIALTTLFTSLFGGITLPFDKNWGLMRELLASPVPRNHIILGIGIPGVTKSFIQVMIIMGFGLIIGVRFFPGYTLLQTAGAILRNTALYRRLFTGISLPFLGHIHEHGDSGRFAGGHHSPYIAIVLCKQCLLSYRCLPRIVRTLSQFNPLTHLVNGVRCFAVGNDFYAIGIHYVCTINDLIFSLLALTGFAAIMYLVAWQVFKKAVVT